MAASQLLLKQELKTLFIAFKNQQDLALLLNSVMLTLSLPFQEE